MGRRWRALWEGFRGKPAASAVASRSEPMPESLLEEPLAGSRRHRDSQTEKALLTECLTPRERETCLLLLEGYTLKETASRLGIGYSTANTHQTAIYKNCMLNRGRS